LERFCRRSGLPIPELSKEALAALHHYSWPGNVRELKNVMERAPFVCAGGPITAEHIPTQASEDLFSPEEVEPTEVFIPARAPWKEPTATAAPPLAPMREPPSALGRQDPDAERARIADALEQCAGNQTRAARLLGVSRRTLINHLERLNMPRPKKS
jgi:DNA-binding NtrC family response regulator